jgi:hypothetical protein
MLDEEGPKNPASASTKRAQRLSRSTLARLSGADEEISRVGPSGDG